MIRTNNKRFVPKELSTTTVKSRQLNDQIIAFVLDNNIQGLISTFNENKDRLSAKNITAIINTVQRSNDNQKQNFCNNVKVDDLITCINSIIAESTPKDISLIINGVSKLGYREDELSALNVSAIADRINTTIGQFNTQDISLLLNSLVHLGKNGNVRNNLDIKSIAAQINQNIATFNPKYLAMAIGGLATLGYDKAALRDLDIGKLMQQINSQINSFSARDISVIINALAKLGYNKSSLNHLNIRGITTQINANITKFTPQIIPLLINSLSKLEYDKNSLDNLDINKIANYINTNISRFDAQSISLLINGLSQLGYDQHSLNKLDISALIKRTNSIINVFSEQGITLLINGVSKLGYRKDELSALNVVAIVDRVNATIGQFKAQDIALLLNAFAQLGYGKDELSHLNVKNLLKKINEEVSNFTPQHLSLTMNALSQLRYSKVEFADLSINNILKQINAKINEYTSQNLSLVLNGISQLGYNKDELQQLDISLVVEQINSQIKNIDSVHVSLTLSALSKMGYKISNLVTKKKTPIKIQELVEHTEATNNQDFYFYLCQSFMWFDLKGQETIGRNTLESIIQRYPEKYLQEQIIISDLHKNVTDNIANIAGMSVFSESKNYINPVYQIEGKTVLSCDIVAESDLGIKYYIEVDGPEHYTKDNNIHISTIRRNELFEYIVLRNQSQGKHSKFVAIPYFEYNKATDKTEYLLGKLKDNNLPKVAQQGHQRKAAEDIVVQPNNLGTTMSKPRSSEMAKVLSLISGLKLTKNSPDNSGIDQLIIIIKRINGKIHTFDSHDLLLLINRFVELGYDKTQLSNLSITELQKRIIHILKTLASDNSSRVFEDISKILSGLTKLGYDESQLSKIILKYDQATHKIKSLLAPKPVQQRHQRHQRKAAEDVEMQPNNLGTTMPKPESSKIATVLSLIPGLELTKNSPDNLGIYQLINSINGTFHTFNSHDILLLINRFVELGYDKTQLSTLRLEIRINSILKTSTSYNSSGIFEDISKILSGLAKLEYDKDSLNTLNLKHLITRINGKIHTFDSQEISLLINGLADLDYKKSDLVDLDFNKLVKRAKNVTSNKSKDEQSHILDEIYNKLQIIGYDIDKNSRENKTEASGSNHRTNNRSRRRPPAEDNNDKPLNNESFSASHSKGKDYKNNRDEGSVSRP